MNKQAVVLHSGGMDSSICLALAKNEFGAQNILSISFFYDQRHGNEIQQAKKIAETFGIDHVVVNLQVGTMWKQSSLVNKSLPIFFDSNGIPNSFVPGRNGTLLHLAANYAYSCKAQTLFIGVLGLEGSNSGYPDCSRSYIDLMQEILRQDLFQPAFSVRTPLVFMTKCETLELAHSLGILELLLNETITCYEGIPLRGCQQCPACQLRNEGIQAFRTKYPEIKLPY